MLRILGVLNPCGTRRGNAAIKRRSRVHQPCVNPLEVRALLASFQGLGANTTATDVSANGSVVVGNVNAQGPFTGPKATLWYFCVIPRETSLATFTKQQAYPEMGP